MKKRQYKKLFKKELSKMPPSFHEMMKDNYFSMFPMDLQTLRSLNAYPGNAQRYVDVFEAIREMDWSDLSAGVERL